MSDKQKWAAYYAALKKWEKARPKSGNNYELESWLEEKPIKPGELA